MGQDKVKTLKEKTVSALERMFSIDLRSLALFRVLAALILLCDYIDRSTSLVEHYTDWGSMPREILPYNPDYLWLYTFHGISGHWLWVGFLFVLAAIFAVMWMVGFFSRMANFFSWIFICSLQMRNFIILYGADVLLKVLIFWGMFLPTGAKFSIDRAAYPDQEKVLKKIFSIATAAILLQVCFVYWFSIGYKWNVDWLEGRSVQYALSIDQFATTWGVWLRSYPKLLTLLTYGVLAVEAFGPLLAIFPFKKPHIRVFALMLMIGLHVGMGMMLYLGIFSYVAAVGWLLFLPSEVWDWIFSKLRTEERVEARISFNSSDERTTRLLALFQTFFLIPETQMSSKELKVDSSWTLETSNQQHLKGADAFVELLRLSPIIWPIAPLFGTSWGRRLYERVANRPKSLRWLTNMLYRRPIGLRSTWIASVVVAIALVCVVMWNWYAVKDDDIFVRRLPKAPMVVVKTFHLQQWWNMFSRPMRDDGWFIIAGKLVSGKTINLFKNGEPIDWEKPPLVSDTYYNSRWRKNMINLTRPEFKRYLKDYCRWWCREWNSKHYGDEELEVVQVVYMRERTRDDFTIEEPRKILYYTHFCGE